MKFREKYRRVVFYGMLLLAVVGAGEAFCRIGLGLGDPVLMAEGKNYRYICKPNQDLYRMGRHVFINQWSMRSDPLSKNKQDPDEYRVMIVGDSIVFGMTIVDQSRVMSTQLMPLLSKRLGRPVRTMNVSAGSWAISDEIGYLNEFGTFDADLVVWFVNSGDLIPQDQNARIVGVRPDYPAKKPASAIFEMVDRYLLPRLGLIQIPEMNEQNYTKEEVQALREHFRAKIEDINRNGVKVMLVLYPNKGELNGLPEDFVADITEICQGRNVAVINLTRRIREATKSGVEFYYDGIHPSPEGNDYLAKWMADFITSYGAPAPAHGELGHVRQ